ncbi:helix-turn-helix domain-containing protein [Stenotrophomonas maltophilia]|uniref:helix-turn-helix domain-containing protein n=1 Tax=Stenotrophomonas maltophilia TaxID=40324 RepID=UPI002B1D3B2D|nr:helix-turn-helix domain-containing protein [Stenotrophomonas maltophilia]
MNEPKAKLAYNPEEAAEQLGVSRNRFYELQKAGLLQTYKDGKRRLCSHAALVSCQQAMEKASREGKAA